MSPGRIPAFDGEYSRMRSAPSGPGRIRSSTRSTATGGAANSIKETSPLRRSSTVALRASGGLPAASRSRKRLTRGSRGIRARITLEGLERQRLPSRRRPFLEIEAVIGEQRDGQAIDAERDAAGMRQLAIVVTDAPHLTEVLTVIVEAHAGGGRCARIIRNQQFEFQCLLALADRHYLTHPTEERIVRDVDGVRQTQLGGQ